MLLPSGDMVYLMIAFAAMFAVISLIIAGRMFFGEFTLLAR